MRKLSWLPVVAALSVLTPFSLLGTSAKVSAQEIAAPTAKLVLVCVATWPENLASMTSAVADPVMVAATSATAVTRMCFMVLPFLRFGEVS